MKALIRCLQAAFAAVICLAGVTALAAENHAKHLKGPFTSGPEVTKACLQCHEQARQGLHEDAALDLERAPEDRRRARGGARQEQRDQQLLHRAAVQQAALHQLPRRLRLEGRVASISARPRTSTAWSATTPPAPTRSCRPAPAIRPIRTPSCRRSRARSGRPWISRRSRRSVGPTSRATCGACHFFGGGGDHIKHGDLDSSLTAPKRADGRAHGGRRREHDLQRLPPRRRSMSSPARRCRCRPPAAGRRSTAPTATPARRTRRTRS